MKTKKEVLTLEHTADYFLAAVSCHRKNIRFVWELNQALNCSFERIEDYEIVLKKGQTAGFRMFQWHDEEESFTYVVIENKSKLGPLIPEHGKMDYLFAVTGAVDSVNTRELLSTIKKMNDVLLAFEIDLENTKSTQNLILE